MRRLAWTASTVVLALAGCGGDDADSGERDRAIVGEVIRAE